MVGLCATRRGVGSSRTRGSARKRACRFQQQRRPATITLTIVGGANGAGKSSITAWAAQELLPPDVTLVDPDAIARKGGLTPIGGGRAALSLIESTIARRSSLLVETTLAGRNALRYVAAARSAGYLTQLFYIGTEDVDINLRRIRERVVRGGHDVPEVDVRRRWQRSLAALPFVLAEVGRGIMFDNSSDEGFDLVASADAGQVELLAPLRPWANDALVQYQTLMRSAGEFFK